MKALWKGGMSILEVLVPNPGEEGGSDSGTHHDRAMESDPLG